MDKVLQGLTAGIAVAALIVSFLQAYRAQLVARQANAGPVMASVYSQFRDPGFRSAITALRVAQEHDLDHDFSHLLAGLQDNAYTVCYFFEYIGLLVAFHHLDQELVLNSMSTQLIDVWRIMRPAIAQERKSRSRSTDLYDGKRFLPHYEHLIALIALQADGQSGQIIRRHGLCSLPSSHPLYPRTPASQSTEESTAKRPAPDPQT
jgi:hypothetical protein